MHPSGSLISVLIGILLLGTLAAMYVAGAWAITRRFGRGALVITWLAAALAYATFGIWRFHQAAATAGVEAKPGQQSTMFFMFLGLGVPAFGASSIIVHRRLKANPRPGLTTGTMLLGVGAFFAALGLVFLAVLVFDLGRLIRP